MQVCFCVKVQDHEITCGMNCKDNLSQRSLFLQDYANIFQLIKTARYFTMAKRFDSLCRNLDATVNMVFFSFSKKNLSVALGSFFFFFCEQYKNIIKAIVVYLYSVW